MFRFHWALLVGPKSETNDARGVRYHAKEQMTVVNGLLKSVWQFEERDINMAPSAMILVRILVGKVKNRDRVAAILRSIPIRGEHAGWNCVSWVQEALQALQQRQISQQDIFERSSYQLDWHTVSQCAMVYVAQKAAAHRFDGQAAAGTYDNRKVATWDLLKNKEQIA